MITIARYNPASLSYEVGPNERDHKIANIKTLNEIQQALGKGPLTEEQFYSFLERDLKELDQMVFDQSNLVERIHQKFNSHD